MTVLKRIHLPEQTFVCDKYTRIQLLHSLCHVNLAINDLLTRNDAIYITFKILVSALRSSTYDARSCSEHGELPGIYLLAGLATEIHGVLEGCSGRIAELRFVWCEPCSFD